MTLSRPDVPEGFAPTDSVGLLASSPSPIMHLLHPEEGHWLVPDQAPLGREGLDGSGSTVVVVDTGVHPDHPTLRGRIDDMMDLTGTGAQDRHGHGTSVAAILAAASPGVRIISIKALRDDATADVAMLAAGIMRAGVALSEGGVINVSAGRRTPTCTGTCPLCSAVDAVRPAIVVAAAGNDVGVTYCPAREAIAVGAAVTWDADSDFDFVPPGWRSMRV